MMKKLLVLLLSVMMVMSLVACGGDDTTADDVNQQVEENVDAGDDVEDEVADDTADATDGEVAIWEDSVHLALGIESVEQVAIAEMVDLSNTAWAFSGSLLDGVEISQEEYVDVVVQNYNGMFEFVFDEDGVAYMVYGGHTENPVMVTGEYGYSEDGTAVFLKFDVNGQTYAYVGMLAPVDDGAGNTVNALIAMADPTDFTNALYFILE